jgi:protein SCO1/2
MAELSRRDALALPGSGQRWKTIPPREAIRNRYFPEVLLWTQDNRRVRLYQDLIKDKIVLLNFMFASCDRLCPRVVHNLAAVQKLLGNRVGREVFLYSFTLDPARDTPEVLKKYAATHQVGPGWSFLTGTPPTMEMLRRRLGFTDPDPALDSDRESHIGNVRYGNEALCLWGACPGMSRPEYIVESLSWVDRPREPVR